MASILSVPVFLAQIPLMIPTASADPAARAAEIPPDFLNRAVSGEKDLRLTLPNGRQVLGSIEKLRRNEQGVEHVDGSLKHPEPGVFAFGRDADGKLHGGLSFNSANTQWKIVPSPHGEGFQMVEQPCEDAFRPRRMELPDASARMKPQGMSREEAENSLRKDLKIEKITDTRFRIGEVELDQELRAIRFPAAVNMHDGTVEYAVVTHTGKRHESLFSTTASPRDIHVAMLLLGVKPAAIREGADKTLIVPAGAAVGVEAEWGPPGETRRLPVSELVTVARTSSAMRGTAADTSPGWLYNGSRFNDAGFAATVEGSIVSLIADDMALINNTGKDRTDDEIHLPHSDKLPRTDTPVSIIVTLRKSS